jgi:hypothetical protein
MSNLPSIVLPNRRKARSNELFGSIGARTR